MNKLYCDGDIFIIINPAAGKGKGREDWPFISSMLKNTNLSFEFAFTSSCMHAKELAIKAIHDGYRTLIAVGGDGTLNEIANGILEQNVCPSTDVVLGMIPIGSGNDWRRMFKVPDNYTEVVDIIKKRNLFLQDAGKVKYFNDDKEEERYFVNNAGIGFDAKVVDKTNKQKAKSKSGKFLYLYNLVTSLFSFHPVNAKIIIDGQQLKTSLFTMSLGICKYSGGGMMQLPDAIADDGLFDITIIQKIGKIEVIKNVKNLYDGSFVKHPKVQTYRAKKIIVNATPSVSLEVDGESLGSSPLTFEIIPRCLKVITGF
jgi:YegS/Rv2252/BmrU family lipid kinase